MPTTSEIIELGASALASAIARGDVSAVEAVDAHIARCEAVNGPINAIVVPLYDEARTAAKQADELQPSQRGPLHGVPITVKECFDVVNTPSTAGIPARVSHRATQDAALVRQLRRAGAIILGKTNVSQQLMYVETENPVYGLTKHPSHPERSCGGSSGGEGAIVASRGSSLGIGTDIGGSVRIPAHACGIHSLKPTPGRLSTDGTVGVVSEQCLAAIPDSPGVLARKIADIRLALATLVDGISLDVPLRGLKIGFYEDDGYFPAAAPIRRAVREAAEALRQKGLDVRPFSPPDVPLAMDLFYGFFGADRGATWRTNLADGAIDPRMKDLLSLTGAPNALRPVIGGVMRLLGQPRLSRAMRVRCDASAAHLAILQSRHEEYRRRFAAAMAEADVDVLLCPPNGTVAFRHGATKELGPASVNYTSLYNLLGYPAGVVTTTTVKPGETAARPRSREKIGEAARLTEEGSEGLSVGVQVAAKPGREDLVLAIMAALEHSVV